MYRLLICLLLISCSKKNDTVPVTPVPPVTPPVVKTTAKLMTLPSGWKFSVNLSNGFPDAIEAYEFDSLVQGNKVKAFAVAFNTKNSPIEFKPVLSATAKKPSDFYAQEQGVVYACINGGFFGGNQSYSLVKYNNSVLAANIKSVSRTYNGLSTPYYPTRAAFGINTAGDPSVAWIYHVGTGNDKVFQYPLPSANLVGAQPKQQPDENFPSGGTEWQVSSAIGGSPMLLKAGTISITDKEELIDINNTTSRPRSAIGATTGGLVLLLAIEGDNPSGGYPGINLADLAKMLKDLGCKDAINLDGGGSTGFIVNNRQTVRPGDNGVERIVPSVVVIKKK
jgi:hypothetical protein